MELDNILRDFRNDVEELRYFATRQKRKRKVYKVRFNPLQDLSDSEFRLKYRFSKKNMKRIVSIVGGDLQVDTRGGGIPVELQVMAVLRYWGRHEIQEDCANIHGMSQQTLSRLCRKVAIALASKSSQYIKMPANINEDSKAIQAFQQICGFRHINGAIDCTHVKTRMVDGDIGCINRNGQYLIKTQVVCDAKLKICDIVAHRGDSTDNATIFQESCIKRRFEENEFAGKLIGDSSYPCTPYLLTPVPRPQTEGEQRYNDSHSKTHSVVERCVRVWKQRFRILQTVMRGSYSTIKTTVIACAVLHNLAILFNEEQDAVQEPVLVIERPQEETNIVQDDNVAQITRDIFIQNYFNN